MIISPKFSLLSSNCFLPFCPCRNKTVFYRSREKPGNVKISGVGSVSSFYNSILKHRKFFPGFLKKKCFNVLFMSSDNCVIQRIMIWSYVFFSSPLLSNSLNVVVSPNHGGVVFYRDLQLLDKSLFP